MQHPVAEEGVMVIERSYYEKIKEFVCSFGSDLLYVSALFGECGGRFATVVRNAFRYCFFGR